MPGRLSSSDYERGTFITRKFWVFLLAAFVAVYAFGFLALFLSDPLGQTPVLDARENLAWAEMISSHDLPEEPFYRALLYPLVLSWMPNAEIMGPALGVLCHFLNALLCGLIARQLWRSSEAACFSGLIYGVYPVSLYFAVQILDITFALFFFLLGTLSLLRFAGSRNWFLPLLAGLMVSLAFLARPNFLPVALVCPLIAYALSYFPQKRITAGLAAALLTTAPLALSFFVQGTINKQVSGEFRILPWQGAYNLYAANREGANGKYYKQRLVFNEVPAGMNPTRMESVYLYRQENEGGPVSPKIDVMNAFWRGKFVERLATEPTEWLGLMARKVTYLINDWEQYNNLSYVFHKERWSLLTWNPLGWGVLLIGSLAALAFGWREMEKPEAASLGLLALAYTAGLLLFFVSARFRLPLAPLLAVICGGLATLNWKALSVKRSLLFGGMILTAGVLVYGNWFEARSRETFKQDQLLLAKAALENGDDEAALRWANDALSADFSLDAARRMRLAALFNLWLRFEGEAADQGWQALTGALNDVNQFDAATLFIRGVILWREGQQEEARSAWSSAVERYGSNASSSVGALEWSSAEPLKKISPSAHNIGEVLKR